MLEWALGHVWSFGWRLIITGAAGWTLYRICDGRLPADVLVIGSVCVIGVNVMWAQFARRLFG